MTPLMCSITCPSIRFHCKNCSQGKNLLSPAPFYAAEALPPSRVVGFPQASISLTGKVRHAGPWSESLSMLFGCPLD